MKTSITFRPIDPRAAKVIASMEVWFREVNRERSPTLHDKRTLQEKSFDSGVFAASEFVRRITGDESLALMVHECCIWRQNELRLAAPERP